MIWNNDYRQATWERLGQTFDLVVIGGGITGAGILREAVRLGLRVLLVEANDFAAGTSSRSSKLVHGGLRYLQSAQLGLSFRSIRERERLINEGRGLVKRLGFLFASMEGDPYPSWVLGLGLTLYDILAMQWSHRHLKPEEMRERCPPLTSNALRGGYRYFDAVTDDARLVFRLINEAVFSGGQAINYARVVRMLQTQDGQVRGVVIRDDAIGGGHRTQEVRARVVVNATGAWIDQLRGQIGKPGKLRILRGSHLVFPDFRLPLKRAISFLHPEDHRPVFAIPWQGVTILGTTDLDQEPPYLQDPAISEPEVVYLLEAARRAFPVYDLTCRDLQVTYSGLRAVRQSGKQNPSRESRDHVIWYENGMLTVAGGKLTTFRKMAHDAFKIIRRRLNLSWEPEQSEAVFPLVPREELEGWGELTAATQLHLLGRYGLQTGALIRDAIPGELVPIENSNYLWAEIRWACRSEAVQHLDDLLLRRLRLGLILPCGGIELLGRIRPLIQEEMNWSDDRWRWEAGRYRIMWNESYAPPSLRVYP